LTSTASTTASPIPTLRLIPLGGLGEFGLNLMVIEYGGEILVVDCGVMFPEMAQLGGWAFQAALRANMRPIILLCHEFAQKSQMTGISGSRTSAQRHQEKPVPQGLPVL